jgi:hypothetical protein
LAIEVSSTSMKVAKLITRTISQGFRLPAAERSLDQPASGSACFGFRRPPPFPSAALATVQRTLTVGTTDMPGPIGYLWGSGLSRRGVSNRIRTGTRWTTFT